MTPAIKVAATAILKGAGVNMLDGMHFFIKGAGLDSSLVTSTEICCARTARHWYWTPRMWETAT